MRLRRKIREVTYNFDDLRDLLAKASPYRSGDALAGIAAESDEQRAAAQMTLADLPLRAFLQHALIPYENDEVTRLIVDSHDPVRLCSGRDIHCGRFSRLAAFRCRDRRDAGRARTRSDAGDGRGGQQVDAGSGPDPGGAQDTGGDAVQDHGGPAGQAIDPVAAEPSRGRSGRHRCSHGRWAPAGLRGCGDRDQSRIGQREHACRRC